MARNNPLQRDMGRLEGKVDEMSTSLKGLIDRIDKRYETVDARFTAQDKRFNKIENRQYYFMGAGGVVGSILTMIANKVIS